MQLQSVPGDPRPPVDVAAARLAAQGIAIVSGTLTHEEATRAAAVLLAGAPPGREPTIHLLNVRGSVAAGLALHDMAHGAHVIAAGTLETAGAIVLAGGGRRTILPTARIHLTPIVEPEEEAVDLERAATEVARLRRQAEEVLGLDLSRSRLLDAEEAVSAGLADQIR